MTRDELTKGIRQLRDTLSMLDANETRNTIPNAAEDIGLAVDDLRRSLWAVLTTVHTGDADAYLRETRVRRTCEVCSDILADVYAGGLNPHDAGLGEFRAWAHGLRAALAGVRR